MTDEIVGIGNESYLATLGAKQITGLGRRILNFALGVQKAYLDELSQASDEALERLRAEMDIGTEFVARMASAHSVHEIATVCSDCGQRQADALCRDSQLLFTRGGRLYERASRLLSCSTEQ